MRSCSHLLPTVCIVMACASAAASETDGQRDGPIAGWTFQTSVYTQHFDPDPEHNNDQNMLAVEALLSDGWLVGLATFDNSFDQPSQLAYAGKSWRLGQSELWYLKLTGGLLHGYKDPYEDKIPLNDLGVAPVIIPAVGIRYGSWIAEMSLGGLAVVAFTTGVRF